jgi:hypothetical protein
MLTGTSTGRVVSDPAGIDCPTTCAAEFDDGAQVTLAASATTGTTFVTWGGSCVEGFGDCDLDVAGPRNVTAQFGFDGEHVWSKAIGGSGNEVGVDVVFDASGNLIATGRFSSAVDFGDGKPLVPTGTEAYVAKLDPVGALVWVQQLDVTPRKLAVDQAGNVYVGGDSDAGILVARLLAADGAVDWTEEVPGDVELWALDARGANVVAVGSFDGTVDFGAGDLGASNGLFIAWYGAGGGLVRALGFGSTGTEYAIDVALDDAGGVYVTGANTAAINLGGGTLPFNGTSAGFVAKYSSAGAHQWSKPLLSNGSVFGLAVNVDGGGNVYVAGVFDNSLDFGGGAVTAGDGTAMYVASYRGSDGGYRWAVSAPAIGQYCTKIICLQASVVAFEIAADPRGRVIVAGQFIGNADFGGGVQNSFGGEDVFVAHYRATDGAYIRSPSFGRAEAPAIAQFPLGDRVIAVDRLGNVAITGTLTGNLGFGGPVLMPDGNDAFLVKFGP